MGSYAFLSGFACHDCGFVGSAGCRVVDEGLRAPLLVDGLANSWAQCKQTQILHIVYSQA